MNLKKDNRRRKIRVGLIYGGQSFEHEVSKMTAKSILENIDRARFDVVKIFIDQEGNFDENRLKNIDIAFLAVHGPNCEDGKLQKFLEGKGVKYTGAGVESSRLNMDKIRQHESFKSAGLNVTDYIVAKLADNLEMIERKVKEKIGYPCFIKPNNSGSSIGMTKVESEDQIEKAVEEARKYDGIIIIEKAIDHPREIEAAILGNSELTVSEPGEILSRGEFYSYRKKYFQPFITTVAPSDLSKKAIEKIKEMAVEAYRITGCRGYARVDFFLDPAGEIYINEINTLPGFTKISMFPQMMMAKGISYKDLITRIIMLGLER